MPFGSQSGLQPAPRVSEVASSRGIDLCSDWLPHGVQYDAIVSHLRLCCKGLR